MSEGDVAEAAARGWRDAGFGPHRSFPRRAETGFFFDRAELQAILNLYGFMVAAGRMARLRDRLHARESRVLHFPARIGSAPLSHREGSETRLEAGRLFGHRLNRGWSSSADMNSRACRACSTSRRSCPLASQSAGGDDRVGGASIAVLACAASARSRASARACSRCP